MFGRGANSAINLIIFSWTRALKFFPTGYGTNFAEFLDPPPADNGQPLKYGRGTPINGNLCSSSEGMTINDLGEKIEKTKISEEKINLKRPSPGKNKSQHTFSRKNNFQKAFPWKK